MKYLNSTPLSVPQVPRALKQLWAFLESHLSYPILRSFAISAYFHVFCFDAQFDFESGLIHLLDEFRKFVKVSRLILGPGWVWFARKAPEHFKGRELLHPGTLGFVWFG